ncbi:MAG: COG4280 domain-containing protein [Roseiflexaceae bacterium]
MQWVVVLSAFAASLVEFVEAFTIVLVVGVTINWRSALVGTAAAVLLLAVLVGLFGTALVQWVPLDVLRLVIGTILVLFGLKWLKKAILRYAGLKALHDEEAIFEQEQAAIRARGEAPSRELNHFGVALAFKSVLLEGLEVAFIVITFGVSAARAEAEKGAGLASATLGALAALVVVILVGALVHAPLRRIPENTLKFIVGIMLTVFGTFWAGEGLGVEWFAADLSLLVLVGAYLLLSWALVVWLRGSARPASSTPVKYAESIRE